MEFQDWVNFHDYTSSKEGDDVVVECGELTVALVDTHTPEPIVLVTDRENPQDTDYKASVDDVEFTENGVNGEFVGNMRDKDGFSVEELEGN